MSPIRNDENIFSICNRLRKYFHNFGEFVESVEIVKMVKCGSPPRTEPIKLGRGCQKRGPQNIKNHGFRQNEVSLVLHHEIEGL